MVSYSRMLQQLELHEGLRPRPYVDSNRKLIIGVGYNVTDRKLDFAEQILERKISLKTGITSTEALKLAFADIIRIEAKVRHVWPFYFKLDEVRQRVVLDLTFLLEKWGETLDLTMKKCQTQDYEGCSEDMKQRLWFSHVGSLKSVYDRGERLCTMMKTGKDYTR